MTINDLAISLFANHETGQREEKTCEGARGLHLQTIHNRPPEFKGFVCRKIWGAPNNALAPGSQIRRRRGSRSGSTSDLPNVIQNRARTHQLLAESPQRPVTLALQRPAFYERRAAAAAVSVVWRPASGEPPANTAGPDSIAGYRYAACKRPRNPSSDIHAAEIWIFKAGALNLCYAGSIPREVLLSRDPPDRLLYGRSGIFY